MATQRIMFRKYTCPISGDEHSLAVNIDGDVPQRAISPETAHALLRLAAVPNVEWVKVARIEGPGDTAIRLVLDNTTAEINDAFEAAGRAVRHGDVYETDQIVQAADDADKGNATVSGMVDRQLYSGHKDRITMSDLNHPDADQYISLLQDAIDEARARYSADHEPNSAGEAIPAELEGRGEDAGDRGDEGQDVPTRQD